MLLATSSGCGIAKFYQQGIALAAHARIRDIFFAQRTANIARCSFQRLVQRRFHVDLQQKVHTAAQVQTEIHRQRVQVGQPLWRTRQQIERHHIIFTQLCFQQVFGFELQIRIGKTRLDTVAFQLDHFRVDVGRLECRVNATQQGGIRLQTGAQRQDLHGW